MAYTITAVPAAYSSVHDDLVYTVAYPDHTSDPVTYPNYKFIGDVYVGATLVARIKKVPDPITAIGIFNVGQIVRNYLATVFNPGSGIVCQQMGDGIFSVQVTMKFGEEYSFSDFTGLLVDSARVFFNNYNGRLIGPTSSLIAYVNNIASNGQITRQVLLTSAYSFISFFATSGGSPVFSVIPHGGGTTYTTTFSPTAGGMAVLNVSPVAINAVAPGTINAATDYYIVNINGQPTRYDIICEAIFRVSPIHFLNQYGGFESKLFAKLSRRSVDLTRTDFGKLPYTVDGSGVVSWRNSNGVYNESRSVYAIQYKEKLVLNTDNLTDAEYVWLQDLILSPMVYIEDGGYFFPCVITDNSYEKRKFINDEMTNLVINIEFGQNLNSQYR